MFSFPNHRAYWFAFTFAILSTSGLVAQQSTKVPIEGIREPVEVLRDQWGVNHIYARNEYDLFFAQGYTAAKDRLFQFELWRRRATGTVAEILGPQEVQRDIGARLFKYRGDLKAELNHYHSRGEMIINAYVDGVNALIEAVLTGKEKLPIEFQMLGILPRKWTPEVVISRHQGLLGNIGEELNMGMAVARAGAGKVKELMWFHPKDPDIALDTTIRGELLSPAILAVYNAWRRNVLFRPQHLVNRADTTAWLELLNQGSGRESSGKDGEVDGSNNWIIAGTKSQSGYPMLANDPHRAVTVPSLRYMVHLVAPGWNVIGGGEPVIPGVSIGHNEYGAWGLTIYKTDGEDLYVYDVRPDQLNEYWYKGEWVRMQELQETIPVKGGTPQTAILRYTVHGPVTYIDSANHKAYAIRCAWLEPGGAPYLASLRMDQAKSWEEFREACRYSHIPGENMIWADRAGNIGWQVVGIIPHRRNFSGMVPVPGDGRYEWDGYIPILERPSVSNPAKGFLATANQHVTPDDYTRWEAVGYSWSDPFRGDRINEVLSAKDKLSVDDMKALQADYHSIPARTLVPMLSEPEDASATVRKAWQQMQNWNFALEPSSVAAGIYVKWEREILAKANREFVPDTLRGLVNLQLSKVLDWLGSPDARFGIDPQRGKDAFLRDSFVAAVGSLEKKLGADIDNWQYGQEQYKHVSLVNTPVNLAGGKISRSVNIGPVPRGGNAYTANATGSGDNQTHGASFRLIVDLSNWDKTLMINTPGQSGDPASPYYDNLFELWSRDEYFPAYYSRKMIRTVTKERSKLVPDGKVRR